jgi:hypothetical protein
MPVLEEKEGAWEEKKATSARAQGKRERSGRKEGD